jgi:hypothetical protein
VVDKVAPAQDFLRAPGSQRACAITTRHHNHLYLHVLLLEEQKAEAREPSKMHFFKLLTLDRKEFPFFRHERVQHSLFDSELRSFGLLHSE